VFALGVTALVALALWLASVGAGSEMAQSSLEQVRPARAVSALVVSCLGLGCAVQWRQRGIFALVFIASIGAVFGIGLLTALDGALGTTTDALNNVLRPPGK
jgi:hypothetical protein